MLASLSLYTACRSSSQRHFGGVCDGVSFLCNNYGACTVYKGRSNWGGGGGGGGLFFKNHTHVTFGKKGALRALKEPPPSLPGSVPRGGMTRVTKC